MAWQQRHQQQILDTLAYFDKYDYPLTWDEIKYWSSVTHPRPSLKLREGSRRGELYFLPGRSQIVALRQQREKISQQKWQIAAAVGERLKKFPTIAAVFVTGALAMNNSPVDDDIDLMIVTYPNTLWLTRLFLNLYLDLYSLRRHPGQTTAPNKICPNLWLDTNNLAISDHSLYTTHEILQAKVLWDRAGVHRRFLKQNSWVKDFLPVAYFASLKNLKLIENWKLSPTRHSRFGDGAKIGNLILWPLNAVFFAAQYLYMLPKKTTERVGLGFAFFHPKSGE